MKHNYNKRSWIIKFKKSLWITKGIRGSKIEKHMKKVVVEPTLDSTCE
jgi:hypothetical protein